MSTYSMVGLTPNFCEAQSLFERSFCALFYYGLESCTVTKNFNRIRDIRDRFLKLLLQLAPVIREIVSTVSLLCPIESTHPGQSYDRRSLYPAEFSGMYKSAVAKSFKDRR